MISTIERCASHPNVRATATCERCGTFVCLDCFDIVHGRELCHACVDATAVPLASRPRRLVARAIDHVLATAAIFGPLAAIPVDASSALATSAFVGAIVAYFAVQGALLGARGQTVGKAITGIAIRRPDGSPVPTAVLLLRRELPIFVGMYLPLLIIVGLVLAGARAAALTSTFNPAFMRTMFALTGIPGTVDALSIFRAEGRCIHDLVADTVVVPVGARTAP